MRKHDILLSQVLILPVVPKHDLQGKYDSYLERVWKQGMESYMLERLTVTSRVCL